jgi:hypothetical protein
MGMNIKTLVALVIDGKTPDGTTASDELIHEVLLLCGSEDPALCDIVHVVKYGRHLDGATADWDERAAALVAVEELTGTSPDRSSREMPVDEDYIATAEKTFAAAESQTREARRELADRHLGDGRALREPPIATRATVDVRRLLEEGARTLGYQPDELLRPIAAGRPSSAEQTRRDALALVVLTARENGGRLAEIGDVIGIPKQRVADLEQRGRALAA